jgi:SAM-dependent methyltransferase
MKHSLEDIRKHWETAAMAPLDRDGLRPTARDPYLQEVVEHAIEERLAGVKSLLDVGCGDGLSTVRFSRKVERSLGVDYIESFVQACRKRAQAESQECVRFEQASVLDLGPIREQCGPFDAATSIRCLINLPDWDLQRHAIGEIADCLREGGLLFISEGWREGFENLNACRRKVGLSEIPMVDYNLLISRAVFEKEVADRFDLVEYVNLGLYVFLSRIVQPLFVFPEPPSHRHRLNEVAAGILNAGVGGDSFADCDYCGVYILKRKS